MSQVSTTLDPATFDFVRKLVADASAIALEPSKGYLVESRLVPVAHAHGLKTVQELVSQLKAKPCRQLHTQVVEAMTTNETSFFRDLFPFEVLKTVILPELLRSRANQRVLRIYCAACSSGQEPYTIALLLCEHFPQLRDWDVQILATDLSQQMIDRAQKAEYTQLEVNRGLPVSLLVRHFQKVGLHWQLKPEIRRLVKFQRLNLIEAWPALPRTDIVFMRNVLIYFTPDTKRQILAKVRKVIALDGTLFLGGAETTLGISNDWQRINHGKTSTYRLTAQSTGQLPIAREKLQ